MSLDGYGLDGEDRRGKIIDGMITGGSGNLFRASVAVIIAWIQLLTSGVRKRPRGKRVKGGRESKRR